VAGNAGHFPGSGSPPPAAHFQGQDVFGHCAGSFASWTTTGPHPVFKDVVPIADLQAGPEGVERGVGSRSRGPPQRSVQPSRGRRQKVCFDRFQKGRRWRWPLR